MAYSKQHLRKIYDCTSGYCHLCRKKLAFKNYGALGARGCWEVEHSRPRSTGGTNHLNNLYPACISCNRKKGNGHNRSIRSKNGLNKAPLSIRARKKAKLKNATLSGIIGGALGSFLGPWGAAIGATIGGSLGYDKNPDLD